MRKRIISATVLLIICFMGLAGRLFNIATSSALVSAQSHLREKSVSSTRGTIYDCNGKRLVNNKKSYAVCLIPTKENAVLFSKIKGKNYTDETLAKGYFTIIKEDTVDGIETNENMKILPVFERYNDDLALHILGYTDTEGNGVCGIEKYYNEELIKSRGELSVVYSADALGRMLTGDKVEIRSDNYYSHSGISLTINRDIQAVAENAMKNGNINKGAVVVLEADTGAICACASAPSYKRDYISDYLNSEDSPFLNRALSAFPVGSVFKPVTAAAAIENNIELKDYYCNGKIDKNGNTFNCNKKEGHGKLSLDTALAYSCNPYFIELSTETGVDALLETAVSLGFGRAQNIGNGFMSDTGNLPKREEINSEAALGNLGFGQGSLTATPLQIAACFATIANGGIYNKPYIFKGSVNKNGALMPEIREKGTRVLNKNTCNTISQALLKTVTEGTGNLALSPLFDACAKTATAQSGQYDDIGNEIMYCWFVGFFPYPNPKYVVCILKENGSSGGLDGAPVFKEISENIYLNNY